LAIEDLIAVAQGAREPDLVLKNPQVINVFSGEIYPADVALYEGQIAGVGSYDGPQTVDLGDCWLSPGLFDGHVHIESSMVQVSEYAKAVVPLGTTSVIIDPHEIANVLGSDGILFMLRGSKYNPLNVFMMLPSCVPATDLETAGSELKALDLFPFLSDKWVLGLGEVMDYLGVLSRQDDVLDKIKIVSGKKVDGHAPGLAGKELAAYVAAGIESDHESTTLEEAREKLRLGMRILLREGTTSKNLRDLLPLVNTDNVDRFVFCTDDRHPKDLLEEGHINYMIRVAIESGIPPAQAVRMATLNTALHFGLDRIGAVAPGYAADLAVVDNLETFHVRTVYKAGEVVAEDGQPRFEAPPAQRIQIRSSINLHELTLEDFRIPADGRTANVIGLIPNQLITEHLRDEVTVKNGEVVSDAERDLIKVVVIERHHASGNIGRGLVRGLGLKRGAIASSVAHDSHNIITAGASDEDMLKAVREVVRLKGGLCVVRDGKTLASLALPIGGLMSDQSLGHVRARLDELHAATDTLGCSVDDPLAALSFLGLTVIPSLRVSDLGLVDVDGGRIVGLFEEGGAP